jgi:hypothetical protein
MSDGIGKRKLRSRLQPEGEDVWSIIDELAETSEHERRRLLRPHAEMCFGDDAQGIIDKYARSGFLRVEANSSRTTSNV